MQQNEKRLAETAREREELTRSIEENRLREAQRDELLRVKNSQHQSDLLDQMAYNQALRHEEDVEEERMWVSQRDAEMEYQRKLEEALDSPYVEKLHPMRRALSGRRSGQMRSAAMNL